MYIFSRPSIFKIESGLFTVIFLGLVFFILYSYTLFNQPARFVSPDETANYYFTKLFAQHSTLSVSATSDSLAPGLIRPRSMNVINGQLVPNSFIGLPIFYGIIGKVFTVGVINFITPLLASISVAFFYLLLKKLFNKQIALAGSLLLFIQPVYWYFSGRSLMHNVSFTCFLIIAFYYFLNILRENKISNYILLGIALSLALAFRTAEMLWLVPLFIILLFFNRKKINWLYILIGLFVMTVLLIPVAYFNHKLYGSFLAFGYSTEKLDFGSVSSATMGLGLKISQAFFPFGLHIGLALQNFYDYFISLFPWYTIPSILGLILFFRNWFRQWLNQSTAHSPTKEQKVFALIFVFILLWLVLYYGSWDLKEFNDPDKIILGHSYLRYWLPLFVFSLPFCVYGYLWIGNCLKQLWVKRFYLVVLIILIVSLSLQTVLFDPLYGLVKIRRDIEIYQELNQKIQELTPVDSVIISSKADKVFFPERQVIAKSDLNSTQLRQQLKVISERISVYFYCQPIELNCQELVTLTYQYLPRMNLEFISTLSDQLLLYQVEFR